LEGILASAKAVTEVPDNTDKAMQSLRKAGNEFVLVCTKYGIGFH
jgi:translation elongation factor EF-Ts